MVAVAVPELEDADAERADAEVADTDVAGDSPFADDVHGSDSEFAELGRRGRAAAVQAARRQAELVAIARRAGELQDRSCLTASQWLSLYCGLAPPEAARCVRLAKRLQPLPQLAGEFARGALSEGVVDLLCRVATPANEAELIEVAHHASGSQLATLVGDYRRVTRDNQDTHDSGETRDGSEAGDGGSDGHMTPDPAPEARENVSNWQDEHGMGRWSLTLTPERSAQFDAALRFALEQLHNERDDSSGSGDKAPTRAEGIERAAQLALRHAVRADGRLPERFLTQIIVDIEGVLDGDALDDQCHIPGAGPLTLDRLRDLLNDSWVSVLLTRRGTPLWSSVPSRFATDAQYRALLARDRTCVFPGCGRRHHLKAHHIVRYADGGPTHLANLVLICQHHHTLIHTPGWGLTRHPNGTITVTQPDNTTLPPPPRDPGPPDAAATADTGLDIDDDTRHLPSGDQLTDWARNVILHNWLHPPAPS